MACQYAKTTLQVKWSSICNELNIDGTPHKYLVRSRHVNGLRKAIGINCQMALNAGNLLPP